MSNKTKTPCSGELSGYILFFFILTSFFWVLLYSFNFSFLQKRCRKNSTRVVLSDFDSARIADPGRCFVGSIVIALFIIGVAWAFFQW
jgi:hypothetical protein